VRVYIICICAVAIIRTQWETTKSASRPRSYAPHPRRRRVSAGASDPGGCPIETRPRGPPRDPRPSSSSVHICASVPRRKPDLRIMRAFSILGIVCIPTLLPASSAIINARHHIYIYNIICVCIVNRILLIHAGTYDPISSSAAAE